MVFHPHIQQLYQEGDFCCSFVMTSLSPLMTLPIFYVHHFLCRLYRDHHPNHSHGWWYDIFWIFVQLLTLVSSKSNSHINIVVFFYFYCLIKIWVKGPLLTKDHDSSRWALESSNTWKMIWYNWYVYQHNKLRSSLGCSPDLL